MLSSDKTVSLLKRLTTHCLDDRDFLVEYFDKEENNVRKRASLKGHGRMVYQRRRVIIAMKTELYQIL